MKRLIILLVKIIVNLIFTIIPIKKKTEALPLYKALSGIIILANVPLFLYTLFTSRYQHILQSYRYAVIATISIELVFMIVFYILVVHLISLVNIPIILVCDFLLLHQKKIDGMITTEAAYYDTGRCIAQLIEGKRQLLYPGELVTIVERWEGKLLIRKFNGEEHLVDSGYIDQNYRISGY